MAAQTQRIDIPLTNSGVVTFERPFGDGDYWATRFKRISDRVAYDYAERREAHGGRRREGANAWLAQVAYDLLMPMLDDGQLDLLSEWALQYGRYGQGGIPASLNPFQIGLMAMFAHAPNAINPQTRERLGKRLWHACRHYVPLEFFRGFIAQLDGDGLEARIASNAIEPGFERWIGDHRAADEDSQLDRGAYPASCRAAAASSEDDDDYGDEDNDDE